MKVATLQLSGDVYGRLSVVAEGAPRPVGTRPGRKGRFWLCRCDCGAELEVLQDDLRSGHTRSCGCIIRQNNVARSTHGHAPRCGFSRTYVTYNSMRTRCLNPDFPNYRYYGGRGIRICERWLASFENFLADMGERPAGLTIDRIDPNGHYEPGNCRWATAKTQGINRRNAKHYEFHGQMMTIAEISMSCGVPYDVLYKRIVYRGQSPDLAATRPSRRQAESFVSETIMVG